MFLNSIKVILPDVNSLHEMNSVQEEAQNGH